MHIFIQEVLVLTGTARRRSGCVRHRVLSGGRLRQPPVKFSRAVPRDYDGVVIVREDVLEAA